MVGAPVALDQRVPDEQLPGQLRVDPGVVDRPADDDRQPEQRDPLGRDHPGPPLRPVRLVVEPDDQVAGQLLGPLRLDPGDRTGPQPGGLHQLGRDHPARRLLGQRAARPDRELRAARPGVLAGAWTGLLPHAQVREQSGQQRAGDRLRVHLGRGPGHRDPELAQDTAQLSVQVLPLAHPQVVQELGRAQPPERAGGQCVLPVLEVVPEVEQGGEVRRRVGEPAVGGVGRLLLLGRPLPRVLDRQRRGDHQHLVQAAVALGLEHHPAQPRVDGQLGERPPELGEGAVLQRAQLVEQGHAVGDRAPVRRVDERERFHVAEPERGHLQDHRGQVGPLHLRFGEPGPGLEVLLGVEADADAVGGTAAATLALVRAGLRDPLDRQPLHLGPGAVAGDPGGAGIDHVPDARDGERGLGDVRGQHDPPAGVRREDLVLVGRGQPGVQRQHLGAVRQVPAQRLRGVADLPLAGEEDQHVAGHLQAELVHRGGDRLDLSVDSRPPRPTGGSGPPPGTSGRRPPAPEPRRSAGRTGPGRSWPT